MGKLIFLLAAIILLCTTSSFAQADSTRYIFGLPVSDDDTVRHFPDGDPGPEKHLEAISPAQLPAEVLEALDKEDQYRGWRDSTVYLDTNTSLYVVPVRQDGAVKIFGLNSEGKPVTFREVRRE